MVGAEELLRARVKALKGKRTQRSLAEAIGVSDTNMSDFLAGEHGLGLERLAPLAKALGTSISDLFAVPEAGTAPVTGAYVHSADGRADADARVLQLEKENASLRAAIKAITRIVTQAAARSAQNTAARPSGRR